MRPAAALGHQQADRPRLAVEDDDDLAARHGGRLGAGGEQAGVERRRDGTVEQRREVARHGAQAGDRDVADERRAGAAEEVALAERDGEPGEHLLLGAALDARGHERGAQPLGEEADGLDDRELGRVGVGVADEPAVELDVLGAQAHDVLEAVVAAAGVLDGDVAAGGADAVERGGQAVVVLDPVLLGELEDELVQPAGAASRTALTSLLTRAPGETLMDR